MKNGLTVINQFITKSKAQIQAALPSHLSPERAIRIALTEVRTNPTLQRCEPASVLGAIIKAAQLGLEPGSALGHCYLVPYGKEAQLQIGYRGMIDLARRSGVIKSISARVVYDTDTFIYEYGLEEKLIHKPGKTPGKLIAVYAVAILKDGGHQFEVMYKEEVDNSKKLSKSGNTGPWKTHYNEMARKTVIRRLFKYLPVSIELQTAVGLDEKHDAGIKQNTADVFEADSIDVTPPAAASLDSLNSEIVGSAEVKL